MPFVHLVTNSFNHHNSDDNKDPDNRVGGIMLAIAFVLFVYFCVNT